MLAGEVRGVIKRSYRDPSLYGAYTTVMTEQGRQHQAGETELSAFNNPTYAPTYKGALSWIRRHIMDIRKTVQLIRMYPSLMEDESLDPIWGLLEPMLDIGTTRGESREISNKGRRSRSTTTNSTTKYDRTERLEGVTLPTASTVLNVNIDNRNDDIPYKENSLPSGNLPHRETTLGGSPKQTTSEDEESLKNKKTVYMLYNSIGRTTKVVAWPPSNRDHPKESEFNITTADDVYFPSLDIGSAKKSPKSCKLFDYSVRNTETPDIFKRIIHQTCDKDNL